MSSLWLPESRPTCSQDEKELDEKLFAHIHLDSRIVGTNLEGEDFSRTSSYVLKVLQFISDPKNNILDQDKRDRIEASLKKVAEEFQSLNALNKKIKFAANKLASDPEKLSIADIEKSYLRPIVSEVLQEFDKSGDVLIPGGWRGAAGETGHAMCYQLVKDKEGGYTFLIYNTGSGLEYHDPKAKTSKRFPIKAYHIPAGPEARERLQAFITRLIRPRVWPVREKVQDTEENDRKPLDQRIDWDRERRFDANRIYNDIKQDLKVLKAREFEKKELEGLSLMSTQGQLSGTCAMRVLMPILHHHLKGEAFQQFLYQFRLQSIIDYYRLKRDRNELGLPTVQRELGAAVEKFARTTRRFIPRTKDGHPVLKPEQVTASLELVQYLQEQLKIHEPKAPDHKVTSEWSLSKPLAAVFKSYANDGALESSLIGIKSDPEERKRNAEREAKEHKEKEERRRELNRNLPKIAEYSDPLEFLAVCYNRCEAYRSLGEKELLLNELENLFLSFPLDLKTATEYWQKITPASAQKAVDYLQSMMRMYGGACKSLSPYPLARQAIAIDSAYLSTSFVINSAFNNNPNFLYLIKHFPGKLNRNYNKSMRGLKGLSLDPKLDQRMSEIETLIKGMEDRVAELNPSRGTWSRDAENFSNARDYYDYKYLESLDRESLRRLAELNKNEGADLMDQARFNLYQLVRGHLKPTIGIADLYYKIIKDYDIYLQFQQISEENKLFKDGGYDYFEDRGEDILAGASKRRWALGIQALSQPVSVTSEYQTKYQWSCTLSAYCRDRSSLKDMITFKTPLLSQLVFAELPDNANERMIAVMAGDYDNLPLSFPRRTLPFIYYGNNESRIIVSLDYFESNLKRLEEDEFQHALLVSLFGPPPILENALIRNPLIATKLINLIEKGFKFHTQKKGVLLGEGGIFLFYLSLVLTRYLKNLPDTLPFKAKMIDELSSLANLNVKINDQLKAYRRELRRAEKGKKEKVSTAKIFEELLTINFLNNATIKDKKYTRTELKNMFLCIFYRRIRTGQTLPDSFATVDLVRNNPDQKTKLQEAFSKLTETEQTKLVNSLVKDILVPKVLPDTKFELELQFPSVVVRYKNKPTITLDLFEGSLKTPGARVGFIPKEFYKDEFIRFFGWGPIQAEIEEVDRRTICRFTQNSKNYQVILQRDNLRILSALGEKELRLEQLKTEPVEETKTAAEKIGLEQKETWYELVHPNSLFFVKPTSLYWNRNRFDWWRSQDSPPIFYCTDKQGNFVLRMSPPKGITIDKETKEFPYTCYELTPKGEETGYTFLVNRDEGDSLHQSFAQFEKPEFIEILQMQESKAAPEKDRTLLKINMPRYGLEWIGKKDPEGRLELLWSENQDYRLLQGDRQAIPGFPHCLYMENKKAKLKQQEDIMVLIPKQEFYVRGTLFEGEYHTLGYDTENLIPPNILGKKAAHFDWELRNTAQYYQFKLKDGELIANSPAAYLQLAYIYLAKHDPTRARQALMKCYKLGGIKGTREEVTLIRNIMLNIPNQDFKPEEDSYSAKTNEPETIAVRLFAAALLARQKQVSLETPQFSLEYVSPRTFKSADEILIDFQNEKLINFYKQEFLDKVIVNFKDYYKIVGNVPEDMQLPVDFEVQLLRDMHRNKPFAFNRAMEMRRLKLERDLLKKERAIAVKNEKQGLGEKLGQKKLSQIIEEKRRFEQVEEKRSAETAAVLTKPLKTEVDHVFDLPQEIEAQSKIDRKREKEKDKVIELNLPKMQAELAASRKDFALEKSKTLQPPVVKEVEIKDRKERQEPFLISEKQKFDLDLKLGEEINEQKRAEKILFQKYLSNRESILALKKLLDSPTDTSLLSEGDKELQNLERDLLKNANAVLKGEKVLALDTPKIRAEVLGGIRRLLKLPDLVWLYLQNDRDLFKSRTLLDDKGIDELYQAIHLYLLKKSFQQQRMRVYEAIKAIETVDEHSPEFQSYLANLGNRLTETRNFEPNKHPEALVFECLDDKLISADQFKILERLVKKKEDRKEGTEEKDEGFQNEVIQLIMGGGKSKVLLPLLALKKADGSNLSIIEVPPALFEVSVADLQEITQRLFGVSGFPFRFDRDSDCSVANLESLLDGIKQAMTNRQYMLTTAESVQSLQLKYLELLQQVGTGSAIKKQVELLEQMLKLIKERGDVLIDECDTILDPKRELNYTQGSPIAVDPEILAAALSTYRLFDKVNLVLPSGKFTLNEVLRGKAIIVHEEDWDKAFFALAKLLIQDDKSPLFLFASKLDESAQKELIQYLLNVSTSDQEDIPPPLCVQRADPDQKKLLGLMKGEMELFRNTLKRKPNENYGFPRSRDFKGSRELAIPYVANNTPNEKAQFGSVFEIINYTIQLQYQREFIPLDLIRELVSDFRDRAKEEIQGLKPISIDKSKVGMEFKALTGLKLSSIDLNDKEKRENYQTIISQNNQARDYIILNYVLPKIKQYPNILRSNAVNHVSQYRSAQAMSGTPWNASCYHPMLKFEEKSSLGTDGQTIDLFRKKDQQKPCIRVCEEKTPEEVIEHKIINHEKTHQIHAFMDIGALFKGISNFQIALILAEKLGGREGNQVRHILYFNEDNELCALPVGKPIIKNGVVEYPVPIFIGGTDKELIVQKLGSQPEQCFTYYDQRHTMGTDIKQTENTIGIATIDKDTMARDLWQGIMRLRGFAENQTVEVLLPEELRASMPAIKEWKADDIIKLVQDNQIKALTEINLHAGFDKMDDLIRTELLNLIYDTGDVDEKKRLYGIFSNAFKVHILEDPFKKFGNIEKLRETDLILNDYATDCLLRFEKMIKDSNIETRLKATDKALPLMLSRLRKSLDDIANNTKKNCLSEYKHLPSHEEQRSVQVERLKKKEKKKETKKELEQRLQLSSDLKPEDYKGWGDTFPKTIPDGFEASRVPISHISKLLENEPQKFNFSKNLFVSDNYLKTISSGGAYDYHMKPLNFFLLLRDATGELKTLIITQDEVGEFLQYLDKHRDDLKKSGTDAWILSPHNTLVDGTAPIPESKEYTEVLQQIQFLNGDLDKLLETRGFDWLFSGDIIEKLKFINKKALAFYPEKRKFFDTFKEAFDQELTSRFGDYKVTYESLRLAVVDEDIKQLENLLQELHRIPNKSIASYILNSLSEEENLFLMAIKSGKVAVVERLIKEDLQKLDKPKGKLDFYLMIALHQDDPTLYKMLSSDDRFYPETSNTVAWEYFIDSILESNDENIKIAAFQRMQKTFEKEPYYIEYTLEKKSRTFVGQAPEEVEKNMHLLDIPLGGSGKLWPSYISETLRNLPIEEGLALLDRWYKNPPHPVVKDYLNGKYEMYNSLLGRISVSTQKTLFLKLLDDDRFTIPANDSQSWMNCLRNCTVDSDAFKTVFEKMRKVMDKKTMTEFVSNSQILFQELMASALGNYYRNEQARTCLLTLLDYLPEDNDLKSWQKLLWKLLKYGDEAYVNSIYNKIVERSEATQKMILNSPIEEPKEESSFYSLPDNDPLIFKAYNAKNWALLKMLLANPYQDMQVKNRYGDTLLIRTINMRDSDSLDLLLANKNVELNNLDFNGKSPLTFLLSQIRSYGGENLISFGLAEKLLKDPRCNKMLAFKEAQRVVGIPGMPSYQVSLLQSQVIEPMQKILKEEAAELIKKDDVEKFTIEAMGGDWDAMLSLACEHHADKILKKLAEKNDYESEKKIRSFYLNKICIEGHAEWVKPFLKAGFGFTVTWGNKRKTEGWTPEDIKNLMNTNEFYVINPFVIARKFNQEDVVAALIDQGEPVAQEDLIAAIYDEKLKILEALLKRGLEGGIDPNKPVDKDTPLFLALASKNKAMIKLLLKYGADPNVAKVRPPPVEIPLVTVAPLPVEAPPAALETEQTMFFSYPPAAKRSDKPKATEKKSWADEYLKDWPKNVFSEDIRDMLDARELAHDVEKDLESMGLIPPKAGAESQDKPPPGYVREEDDVFGTLQPSSTTEPERQVPEAKAANEVEPKASQPEQQFHPDDFSEAATSAAPKELIIEDDGFPVRAAPKDRPETTYPDLEDSPLMMAVRDGDADLVVLLLESKADLNQTNSRGETAEKIARILQKDEILKLLQKMPEEGHEVQSAAALTFDYSKDLKGSKELKRQAEQDAEKESPAPKSPKTPKSPRSPKRA